MPIFNNISEVKEFINVSNNLDIKSLHPYEDSALNKVCEFIPQDIFQEITNNHEEIMKEIKRAVANYMIVFAIPFLKIHLSNTGGNNFEDSKMKTAQWWDIRDYGLSAVRIADKALSKAINLLLNTDLKKQLNLYTSECNIFKTPQEFNEIYPIGNSWEVFNKLMPKIEYVCRIYLRERLSNCTIDTLIQNVNVYELLKQIVAYYTVSEVFSDPTYLFTTSGIVLQWEELPWQKSKILDAKSLALHGKIYVSKANYLFNTLLSYLKNNLDEFPCFEAQTAIREVIVKKSGIYL